MPTAYMIEAARSARALCQSGPCKRDKIKIEKGEMRLGVWVEIQGHGGWKWRHWGCVSPAILANMNTFLEGNMELLEGFDEISPEWQKKVQGALEQGHVDDEDWRGEAEYNRPGKRGVERTPKQKAADKERKRQEREEDSPSPTARKTKTKTKKRGRARDDAGALDNHDEEEEEEEPVTKKMKGASKMKKDSPEENNDKKAKVAAKSSAKKGKASSKALDTADEAEEEEVPSKTSRRRVNKDLKRETAEDNAGLKIKEPKAAKAVRNKAKKVTKDADRATTDPQSSTAKSNKARKAKSSKRATA